MKYFLQDRRRSLLNSVGNLHGKPKAYRYVLRQSRHAPEPTSKIYQLGKAHCRSNAD
jgi:hypothetical protein